MRLFGKSTAKVLALVGFIFLGTVATSGELTKPSGRVILEISGAIANTNEPGVARFDADMLEDLGYFEVRTETPWTQGEAVFEGPLARDVLEFVGAKGTHVKAVALNDYSVEIPITDLTKINAILATKLNGEAIGVRSRGPLWIIYPWSDYPELKNEVYYSRSIWQLRSLTVIDQ